MNKISSIVLLTIVTVAVATAQDLPAEFDHDRVFVLATAPDGSKLRFFTDSGGGFNVIAPAVATRLKLPRVAEVEGEEGPLPLVDFPAFLVQAGIPAPLVEPHLQGRLAVTQPSTKSEGFLGSRWFADRIWALDYAKGNLKLLPSYRPANNEDTIALGFRTTSAGVRDMHFPRMRIVIDGEPFEVLLDTGASVLPSEAAAKHFNVPPNTEIAGSFIIKSAVDRWRTRHPDWKVLERGESITGKAVTLIEVPQVTIGKTIVGPVWFAERPDSNFREYMSMMMDRPIDGALGGSALKYLHLVIDYPAAKAYIRRNNVGTR